jgi:hypothetical protein
MDRAMVDHACLVDRIYEAAAFPEHCPEVLDGIEDWCRGWRGPARPA